MLNSKAQEIKDRYDLNHIRIDQLKKYVLLEVLSPVEYKTISGLDYIA